MGSSGSNGRKWSRRATPAPGEHVYTVAAQTDTAGLLYLTVPVARTSDGALALAGYPAFVGAPAAGPAQSPGHLREVADPALCDGRAARAAQLPRRLLQRARRRT